MFTVIFIKITPPTCNPNLICIFPMLISKRRIFKLELKITARFLDVLVIEISVTSAAIIFNFNVENQSSQRILLIFLSLKRIFFHLKGFCINSA